MRRKKEREREKLSKMRESSLCLSPASLLSLTLPLSFLLLCPLFCVTRLLADLASLAPKLSSDPALLWLSSHSQTPWADTSQMLLYSRKISGRSGHKKGQRLAK